MPKARMPAGMSILILLTATTAGALLMGCSASIKVGRTTPTLSAAKVGDTVAEKLAAATGQPKPRVTCPEDLVGKVGTTSRCTLTADDGSTLGVTVKVTSVSGGQINFDIKADEAGSSTPN